MAATSPPGSGNSTSVDVTIAPVGTLLVETIASVRSGLAWSRFWGDRDEDVEAEVAVGRPCGHLVRRLRRPLEDLEMRDDGAAFLGEARLVEAADVPAVEERGRAEDLVDGHDAGPTDPHHEHVALARNAQRRLGKRAIHLEHPPLLLRGRSPRHDGQERRAVTVQARVVLVARRLMDLGLPSEFGVDRLDGEAVTFHPAVAAALAHRLVDDDAHRGIGKLAALPKPPLLRRAPLVVDQRGHARDLAQPPLGLVEPVAMEDLHARGPL